MTCMITRLLATWNFHCEPFPHIYFACKMVIMVFFCSQSCKFILSITYFLSLVLGCFRTIDFNMAVRQSCLMRQNDKLHVRPSVHHSLLFLVTFCNVSINQVITSYNDIFSLARVFNWAMETICVTHAPVTQRNQCRNSD